MWGGAARKTARETNSRQKRLSLIICLSAVSGGDDVFEDGGKIRGPRCGREKRGKGENEKKKKNEGANTTRGGERGERGSEGASKRRREDVTRLEEELCDKCQPTACLIRGGMAARDARRLKPTIPFVMITRVFLFFFQRATLIPPSRPFHHCITGSRRQLPLGPSVVMSSCRHCGECR